VFRGFLGIPDLETPSTDGSVVTFETAAGRPKWKPIPWSAPGAIGSTTPNTGAFTTLSASGVITSTLATGTAPFTVASTTVVGNLNVSQLLGFTWAIPGTIGSGTPSTGAFTTFGASGIASFTNTTDASASTTAGVVLSCGIGIAKTVFLAGDGNGGSQQIKSTLGNLIRHRTYGYSNSYTAVQISDSSRGVGFGIDPATITGGQFTGDSTDFFFTRNVAFGCPNAGATDWAWALKIAGGGATKAAPNVEINDTSMVMATSVVFVTGASNTTVASLRIPHGAAPTSPVNGDMWTTTAGLFVRINGVTKTVTLT
jgi:hypothetical protein